VATTIASLFLVNMVGPMGTVVVELGKSEPPQPLQLALPLPIASAMVRLAELLSNGKE
jgi:hypothetical protein